ncbi:MAG: sulfatase, partial [Verrucomicrobiota bacterium]
PELNCYGVDYIHSPNIDKLSAEGATFRSHYVQAPICGASRYALLTGTYGPADNDALFQRAKEVFQQSKGVLPSLPAWFREHGYTTVSIGKVSHHPGGLGGSDWDDVDKKEMPLSWDRNLMPSGSWQNPRGAMHGLANGEIRWKPSKMDVYQSFDGPDDSYPDGLIVKESLRELESLAKDGKPFFLAVGLIRPHLPFGAPAQYMDYYAETDLPPIHHPEQPEGKTTWHPSGEFMKYNRWEKNPNEDEAFAMDVRKHYAACVSYADAQVGRLLEKVASLHLDENTVVVFWGDHGWHLGEHAVWGKHTLFEESLLSPLIIRGPSKISPGQSFDFIVEAIDMYPTLCELAGLPSPENLDGQSLMSQITGLENVGQGAISYNKSAVTLRSDTHRFIAHNDGHVELYSHIGLEKEARNIAESEPELVLKMATLLHERVPDKLPVSLLNKIRRMQPNLSDTPMYIQQ